MSVADALYRLLSASGWQAVRVGPGAYRIEHEKASSPRGSIPQKIKSSPSPILLPLPPGEDIVVTGQKRPQLLQDVAMSISIIPLDNNAMGRLAAGSRELALSAEGLAVTNLGPGRNRQFIRGVADSPFNGPSQSTVAVQLDDARITFDAPDPDLRLIDMERVEILKGPQGPLYGSGALGGIYHIVTRKPDLERFGGSVRLVGEAIAHGGMGAGSEAMVNLSLASGKLALRGVGYVIGSGGYIDNSGRDRNANQTRTTGARLAFRWQPDPEWTIDLSGVLQDINARDSQYVTASGQMLRRNARIAEPTDNDFKSGAATIRGPIGGLQLLATTSHVSHSVEYTLDSSDASAMFGLAGPSTYLDDRKYAIVSHEVRLSPASSTWLAGASYMSARSHNQGLMRAEDRALIVEALDRNVTEFAVFGEVTIPLFRKVRTVNRRANGTPYRRAKGTPCQDGGALM
jgi:outer membrane receptor protein involved in Fe transport